LDFFCANTTSPRDPQRREFHPSQFSSLTASGIESRDNLPFRVQLRNTHCLQPRRFLDDANIAQVESEAAVSGFLELAKS
jgi:hypothetical protein